MKRRTVDDWRKAVYRTAALTDPTKVLLLYLAEHMRADRSVTVKRSTIAAALGKSERRISERTRAAVEAGFLSCKSPGYRGHVPVYEGTFGDVERVSPTSTLSSAETRTLSTRKRVTPGGPTITTADLSPVGHGSDVGRDGGEASAGSGSLPALDCEFHPWTTCPGDCRNHEQGRRSTA